MDCRQITEILTKLKESGSEAGVPDNLLALLTALKLSHCDKYTVMWGERKRMLDQCSQVIDDMRRNEMEPHPLTIELLSHFKGV